MQNDGEHSHPLPIPRILISPQSHDHTVDINHSHRIALGIIEGSSPSGMTLAVSQDGTNFENAENIANTIRDKQLNITSPGWKSIRITSTVNGRVQVQIIVKIRIDTTM